MDKALGLILLTMPVRFPDGEPERGHDLPETDRRDAARSWAKLIEDIAQMRRGVPPSVR